MVERNIILLSFLSGRMFDDENWEPLFLITLWSDKNGYRICRKKTQYQKQAAAASLILPTRCQE